jgi:hypothetical protein
VVFQSIDTQEMKLEKELDMPQSSDFFVGWGTLSLINAGLAQSKGRNGLAWWLASVFLGPLATLLIVVLPKQPSA